ncbi:MAG TPA: DUF748 domain-containing protein, partial [Candidatus Eisenbacteria bacterium]|nr:DUF748 domain-containing protein [Candidatus Eisenbacteria bacterium]
GPPPRFALSNIEVVEGRIEFDDRPERTKHQIDGLRIAVPFVSSIPSDADIRVEPAFEANINGAPVRIAGEAKPFKDSRESTLRFAIDDLQIPKYLPYAPVELGFRVPSGRIDGELTLNFQVVRGQSPALLLSGNLGLKDLVVHENNETPVIKLPALDVMIDTLDVFAGKASLAAIRSNGLELHLTRKRDGTLNLTSLFPPNDKEPAREKKPGAPFAYSIGELLLEEAKLHFTDQGPEKGFEKTFENIRIEAADLGNAPGKKANFKISFDAAGNEEFVHSGTLQLNPFSIDGRFEIEGLQLPKLRPYYESVLGPEIQDGRLDLSGRLIVDRSGANPELGISDLAAALRSVRLAFPGEKQPLWRIPLIALKETAIDLGKKTVSIGALEAENALGWLQREADGSLSYARLIKTPPSGSGAPARRSAPEDGWRLDAKRIAFEKIGLVFEDRSLKAPAKIALSDVSLRAESLSNVKKHRGRLTLRAKINGRGALGVNGDVVLNPFAGQFAVEAQNLELLPLQRYLEDRVTFELTGGRLETKGNLVIGGDGAGPLKVSYSGNARVHDFTTIEKNGAQELLRWKMLSLNGLRFGATPIQVAIDSATLADFYSRLVIGADGRFNLQNLTVANGKESKGAASAPEASAPASASPPVGAQQQNPVTIGKIDLERGAVQFSDFFIKPNYSANLTDVHGTISELRPEAPGNLAINAKLDNAAPVQIRGKINPVAKDLYLDVVADAQEIELNPLSPYSVKYVGYGIEKGKLSFNVKYKIENRKLEAENKIILNQLTFGERVESPTATKLPVLLAVALLKDRNGVIDVNLPISGSLDDPQFSIGGIILRIVINMITRAVTSPFALLGAAFGGGEELSYVEFDYGRANLTPPAEARLKTLAAAMSNRPALKLDITGRADPANDRDGLKHVAFERKLKAQKIRELGTDGAAPKLLDDVRIGANEYERYLKAAYRAETFPKPRNVIGLVKDLPPAEMENLILQHIEVTEADLRELANRRAQAVRDRLLAAGEIGADRLFIVSPKLDPGSGEKPKRSRVDFALK